jgi:hypothetical protein
MGSAWSWTLALPAGLLTTAMVDELLALTEQFSLSPHRPDGAINGFGNDTGQWPAASPQLLDRPQVVAGLATGTYSTNLWDLAGVDVMLSTAPGRAAGSDLLRLSLDSAHCWRRPVPQARPFRLLHHRLTGLWTAIASKFGALFGRVDDEWSLEQVWDSLADPGSDAAPPSGQWPERLGWQTYFHADHHRLLTPLPAEFDVTVHRMPDGAAVIALLLDPAAVDEQAFAQLHTRYRQWTGQRPTMTTATTSSGHVDHDLNEHGRSANQHGIGRSPQG